MAAALFSLATAGSVAADEAAAALAVGHTMTDKPFGRPERTVDADGHLVWPGVERTRGGLASTSQNLARWGHALFGGAAMEAPYLEGVPVASDAPGILYGVSVAIHAETLRGPVYGHGGWIPASVSSLRHCADHGVTVAFQINSDASIVDDGSELVPALEAPLANLAIAAAR